MNSVGGFIVALLLFILSIWISFRSARKRGDDDTADSTTIKADNNKKTIRK